MCGLLEFLCDGYVKVLTVKNCCLSFDSLVMYKYARSIIMDSSISYYGPVILHFITGVLSA